MQLQTEPIDIKIATIFASLVDKSLFHELFAEYNTYLWI